MNARALNSEVDDQLHDTVGIPPPRREQEPVGSVISLRNAAAWRAGRWLWSGVDLAVGPGEFVAVLGPNGVGKSTLIQAILGTLPHAAGAGPLGWTCQRADRLPAPTS